VAKPANQSGDPYCRGAEPWHVGALQSLQHPGHTFRACLQGQKPALVDIQLQGQRGIRRSQGARHFRLQGFTSGWL